MIIQERKGKERKRQQKICVVYNLTFRFLSYRKTQQKRIHCFWRKHILLQGNRLCSLNVKPIAEGILSLLCYSKEIGHLQSIYLLCTTSILFRTFTQKSIRAPVSIYKRNHVSVWNWIQRFKPKKILQNKRKVSEFIIDETLLKVGNQYV
jgi:hypothetical protein